MKAKKKIALQGPLTDEETFNYDVSAAPPITFQSLSKHRTNKNIRNQEQITEKQTKSKTHQNIPFCSLDLMAQAENNRKDSIKQEESDSSCPSINDRKSQEMTAQCLAELTKSRNVRSVKTAHNRKKSDLNLKEMISKQKVTILRNKFIQKIKRNITQSSPVDYMGFEKPDQASILQMEGFEINSGLDNFFGLLSIMQVTFLFVMYTLSLVFSDLENVDVLNICQIFSLLFYCLEIVYNSLTIKSTAGRKLITFEQILAHYYHTSMVIDLLNLFILFIDVTTKIYVINYLRLIIIAKLPQCLQKMEKLETFFIKNYYNEQYWSLIKVVLFNFCFAHILAIFLTAMANINQHQNWYQLKDIYGAQWYEKYIWAYYWGVNIMLTVGFGDLEATTYQQALCLIFIEIISVMCLAYNINWVGTLISNIRAQDLQKGKNFKTFKQLSEKYSLPVELQWRISNYIEESVNIRKKFNIQEQHSFIRSLPQTMRKQYLKQSNKSIFHLLPFFSSLVDKTLYNFAEKIEMSISHPEQVLRRIDDDYNLLILREGEIAYTVKRRNCNFNDMAIDRVKVQKNDKPFILGLEFLTRFRPMYQIKSMEYSVVYSLSYDDLISILKESHMDYLHFCFLRDKNKSTLDEFEVLKCQICSNSKNLEGSSNDIAQKQQRSEKHTKFTCPKLHFIPLHQIVIYKQQNSEKKSKNVRVSDKNLRIQFNKRNALAYNKKMHRYLQDLPGVIGQKIAQPSKKRMCNPFLEKIAQMKKLRDSELDQSQSEKIEQWFIKNTSELIKQEFDRYFRNQSFEDEVWSIHCDKMKNYKEYFPESNSCNLEYSFKVEERLNSLEKCQKEEEKNIKIGSFACYLNSYTNYSEFDSFKFS